MPYPQISLCQFRFCRFRHRSKSLLQRVDYWAIFPISAPPMKPSLLTLSRHMLRLAVSGAAVASSAALAQTNIASWEMNGVTAFGLSPFAPTAMAANLSSSGLTRGAGLTTSGTAAGNAWGATGWFLGNDATAAVAANDFLTFTLTPATGFKMSVSSISTLRYRRSAAGPTNGILQVQVGTNPSFLNVATLAFPSSSSGGGVISNVDLTGVAALQNVAGGATATFRLVNLGATNATGSWYVNDGGTATAADLVVSGSVLVDDPNAPQVTAFSPLAGVVGTLVTIAGTNFTGATSVSFGSVSAAISRVTATTIEVAVPVGATNAPINVVTPNGTASSAQSFVILDGSGTATVQNGTAPYTGRNIFPRNTAGQTLQVVYTPPTAGSIEGLRVEVPAAFGAPAVPNVNVTGGGGTPSVFVSGQAITISGLAATSAGNVTVSIAGLAMPDTSTPVTTTGANVVNVQSRGSGGTFSAITSSPSALVTIPLANVRNFNSDYSPVLSNSTVAVQGTASVPKLANRGVNAAIQDSTWGVVLDAATAVLSSNLVRGNNYAAIGQITQFQGVVQVSLTNAADLLDLGAGVDPLAQTATVAQFTNTNTAPGYQSRVVRIENLSKQSGTWATTNAVVLTNSIGEQVTVFIPFNSTATTEPVYPVTITGIGGQSDTAAPFDSGWRIQPRVPADLQSASSGVLSFNPATIASLSSTSGSPGLPVLFEVLGQGLSVGSVVITAPAPFEVSTTSASANDFGSTATLTVSSAGAFTGNAWVRIGASVSAGAVSGSLSVSGAGAAAQTLPVSGNVAALPPNVQLSTTGPLALGTVVQGNTSSPQTFTVQGSNLTGNLLITPPTGVEISNNSGTSWNASTLIIAPSGGSVPVTTISVRIAAAATPGAISGNVAVATAGTATQNVGVTGTVTAVPTITPSATTLAPITKIFDEPSPTRNFTVTGNNLSGAITVTAPAPFQVSLQQNSGYATSLNLTPTAGNILETTIYVRIADATPIGSIPARNITLAGGGADTKTVSVSGQVTPLPPVINVNPSLLEGFSAVSGNASAVQPFTVTARNLTEPVALAAPSKYELSTDGGVTFGPSGSLPASGGTITGATVLVRVSAGAAVGAADGAVVLTSGIGTAEVQVRGTVTAATPLTLRVPPQILAPAETPGRVSISAPSLVDVVVSLFSDQEPVVSVPSSVVIPRGETSAFFTIRTLSVGAPITARIDAIAENYQATFATTEVNSNVTRAASLTERGYNQDFATFVSDRTLPFGWTNTSGFPPQYTSYSAWGTTNAGIKFSVPGTNVFGVQHEAALVFPVANVQLLTLRNDWTSNITRVRIRYDGRTTTARVPSDRDPAYTVQIVTGTNTNTVNLLNYSTGEGDNRRKTASVPMTNTAFPTGLPPWSTFTVFWSSSAGTGFDASKQIGISDVQVELVRPVVTLTNLEGVTDFSTTAGTPSAPRPFRVSGQDLSGNIVVTAPTGFAVSTNATSGPYSSSITLAPVGGSVTNTTIFARLTGATPPGVGVVEGILRADSPNATTPDASASRFIGGTVFAASGAQVYASTKLVAGLVAYRPQPSLPKTFHVSGRGLPAGIILTAPFGFELRVGSTGTFGTSVVVPRDSAGSVSPQPIEVRLARTQLGAYSGDISITSGGVVYDPVRVEGDVVLPPSVIALTGQFTSFSTTRGTPSAPQSCTVEASGLTAPLIVAASEGYQVSLGGAYSESVSLNPTNGVVAATTISVRLADYAPATPSLPGALSASSDGALTRTLPLAGSVTTNANPWISARPSPLKGFVALTNKASEPKTFVVQAANLSTGVGLLAPAGYEISLDGLAWRSSLTLQPRAAASSANKQPKQGPTTVQDAIGDIAAGISTGGGTLDIVKMEVSDTATDVVFNLTINGNTTTPNDWGNFMIGIANGKAPGVTTGNGWNRPINLNSPGGGMTHWIGSWVNGPGGAQLWSYNGTSWQEQTATPPVFARTIGTQTILSYTVPLANLGLTSGDTLFFDAYSSGGGAGDSAVDALSNTNISITTWAGPYTSSTTTGISSYTISGGGGGGSGDLDPTTVLVRLRSGLPVGPVSGNLQASSTPATPRVVVLEGRVASFPQLVADPASLRQILTTAGTASPVKSFVLSGTELDGPVSVSVPANSGFEISLSASSGFGANLPPLVPISGTLAGTTIYVRIPSSTPAGRLASQINVNGFGQLFTPVSLAVPIAGTVFAAGGTAQISFPEPDALTGFSTTAGTASPSQSFVVSGINLTAPITANVAAPYEVSGNGAGGPYAATASSGAPSSGIVGTTEFHVRLAASASATGAVPGAVTLSSTGATARTVSLSGTLAPTPKLFVDPSALSGFESVSEFPSPSKVFQLRGEDMAVEGSGFALVTISVSGPFQISLNDADWSNQVVYTPTSAGFPNTPVYVRLAATAPPGNRTGTVTFSGQGITNTPSVSVPTVTLSGSTLPRPLLSVNPNALGPFSAVTGDVSTALPFAVSGTNLLNNITVAAPVSYEISTNTNNAAAWTNLLTLVRTVSPAAPGAPPVVLASDNGSNYTGGWTNGANGGTGFGPWTIVASNGTGGFAGAFIGNPTNAGIQTNATFGASAFGLFANPPASGASVSATRALPEPLQTNQTFSFQWAINFDTGSTNYKGFRLMAGASQVLEVGQNGFPGDLRLVSGGTTNTNLGIAYGTGPMTWTFAMTNASTLRVTSTPRDGSTSIAFETNLTVAAAPDSFTWFAGATTNTETDQRQPYFNNLQLIGPPTGSNGVVSNATVWVRLKADAAVGVANQTIDVTSPIYAESRQVQLNGEVLPVPLVQVTPAQLTGLEIVQLDPPTATTGAFNLTASNLQTDVNVLAPTGFQISTSSGTGFTNALLLMPNGGSISTNVFVRLANSAIIGPVSGNVTYTSLYGTNRQTNVLRPVSGAVVSWVDRNPNGLRVTNPWLSAKTTDATFAFAGQAGINLTNGISWSNALTKATGSITSATNWTAQLALGVGVNEMTFSAIYPQVIGTNLIAYDEAGGGRYPGGWTNGSQGANSDFGPWSLVADGDAATFGMVTTNDAPNMNVGRLNGFAMGASEGSIAIASRVISNAFSPGDVLTLQFDNTGIEPGGSAGWALRDTNGVPLLGVFYRNDETLPSNYKLLSGTNVIDSGIPFTTGGLTFRVTFQPSQTYRLQVSAISGAPFTSSFNGSLPYDGRMMQLAFSNNNAGPGQDFEVYLGAMTIQQLITTNAEVSAFVTVERTQSSSTGGIPNSWWETYFPGDQSAWVASADPDLDGWTNDMEFAFGTNPTVPNVSPLTIAQVNGQMTVTFLQRTTGVSYKVESRASLSTPGIWQASAGVIVVDGPSTPAPPSGYVRKQFTVAANGQSFYRVSATINTGGP